jgi:hypothetical protein
MGLAYGKSTAFKLLKLARLFDKRNDKEDSKIMLNFTICTYVQVFAIKEKKNKMYLFFCPYLISKH